MTDDTDDPTEQHTTVEKTSHGVRIKTKVKRGTGTRDQDEHTLESEGRDFDEARHYHNQGLAYLDGGSVSDGTAVLDRVREWNPEDES